MNAPAANFWPAASNGSSAASIFTSLFANRNVARLVSPLWSMMTTVPVPVIVPGTRASAVSSVIGWSSTDLSSTFTAFTLCSSGSDHPVSSYGDGLAGEKNCVSRKLVTSRPYG